MNHQISKKYDDAKDEELLKLLRFHSRWDQQDDAKIARLLRLAANRIEDLKGQHMLGFIEDIMKGKVNERQRKQATRCY